MTGKQILWVLAGIAAVYWGLVYFFQTSGPDAEACSGEFRHELPFCTNQDRIGSYLTISNNCDIDVTVKWEFIGGTEHVQTLAPGEEKQMATFPLKIESVSCCSNQTSCF